MPLRSIVAGMFDFDFSIIIYNIGAVMKREVKTDVKIRGHDILNIQSLSQMDLRKLVRLRQLELNSLLEITEAINSNFSTASLFEKYEVILGTQLGVKKLAVFIKTDLWTCISGIGIDKEFLDIDVEEDLLDYKEFTSLDDSTNPNLADFELVIPVYHKDIPLAYVLIGDYKDDGDDALSDIRYIQTITNVIVVAIENKKLVRDQIRQEGVKREMELAAQMQSTLFPSEMPNDDKIQMASSYLPHRDIGGDYYDVIRLGEKEIVFCIADVSGKGFAAGLVMASFQANLHTLLLQNRSLKKLIPILNAKVLGTAKREKFITFFIARYNFKTRVLSYVNAGHNPPILYHNKQIELLKEGCTILGMFDKLPKMVKEGKIKISGEALMLCYTDGLIEVENNKNEAFELDNLCKGVHKYAYKEIVGFNKSIIQKVKRYKGENPFMDDVTLLSCRFFDK